LGVAKVTLSNGDVALFGNSFDGNTCRIYHKNGRWFETIGPMILRIKHASAVLLQDERILIVGGYTNFREINTRCQIYNPEAPSNRRFTLCTGQLHFHRKRCTASLIPHGKILICGGSDAYTIGGSKTTEIYDTSNDSFVDGPDMIFGRSGHTATVLLNGDIFICGGDYDQYSEIYRVGSGKFEKGPRMLSERSVPTSFLLLDGRVAVCGGEKYVQHFTIEIYDPVTNSFTMGNQFDIE
jgi:hypothetical protein